MPELPEVEVIAYNLRKVLENQLISDLWTSDKRLRSQITKKQCQALTNKRVLKVFRRAKFLVIEFKHAWLLIHFGMTGKIFVSSENKNIFLIKNKHIHFLFRAGSSYVYFQDVRRFGGLNYLKKTDLTNNFEDRISFNLGLEPLSENFDTNFLYTKSRKINQPIKSWLMSGNPVAGIGNIYAAEALFRAGIDPSTKSKNLGVARSSRLVSSIKYVLSEAIRSGGSTIRDYSGINGEPGNYSKKHLVYGKNNHLCPVCMKMLSSVRISQRSSSYCKRCQKR